jgi:predicted membrane protein
MIAGALLIGLGVLFTLDNFGVVDAGDIFRYWPLALVGFGLLKLVQARFPEQRVGGVVLMGVGALLLLRTLHIMSFHLREVWPVLLVIGGGLLVWRSVRGRDPAHALDGARARLADSRPEGSPAPSTDGGYLLNEFAFLGGGERIIRSHDFRGGEVTAIMGGFNIDLRGAGIAGDEAVLEVFTLWGGVEIRVPEDWVVQLQAVPILGGISETTAGPGAPPAAAPASRKRLVIRGTAIMGGVEVKR